MENMQAIADKGLLLPDRYRYEALSGIELRIFDGHSPGQLVPYITTSEQTFVFAGDVIPLVASVSPEWISAYDTYPVTSYQEKVRMLEEAAREGQVLIYCHDAYTKCSTVKKVNNFYKKDRLCRYIIIPLYPSDYYIYEINSYL